jgi:hypothetical protein
LRSFEGLDVIITTVPEGAQVFEFLDTAWVTPGAFVGAVDLAVAGVAYETAFRKCLGTPPARCVDCLLWSTIANRKAHSAARSNRSKQCDVVFKTDIRSSLLLTRRASISLVLLRSRRELRARCLLPYVRMLPNVIW